MKEGIGKARFALSHDADIAKLQEWLGRANVSTGAKQLARE